MGLVIYLFVAVCLVLIVGWAAYVLPTPGPLEPAILTVGLLPVAVIMGAVLLAVIAGWALLQVVRFLYRLKRR
jgi:uncharacterized membrane protein